MDNHQQHERLEAEEKSMLKLFLSAFRKLVLEKKEIFNRVLPFGEYFVDRSEKAKLLGFGKGTTVYDSAVIIGDVKVEENTWIGPNVILDGSGGLEIGSNCSISAGVQIYSHDSVAWATSGGSSPYEYAATKIMDNCYVGPNTIIQKGVTIGKESIIGANSLVNISIPEKCKAYGTPVKIIPQTNEKDVDNADNI